MRDDWKNHFTMSLSKADKLSDQGQHEEAIYWYDQALKINLKEHTSQTKNIWSTIWNDKGSSLFALKYYVDAAHCFDKAIEFNNKNDLAWHNKGYYLAYVCYSYKEALFCFQKALEHNPNNNSSLYNKAICEENLGQKKRAINSYKTFINLNKNNPELELNVSYARRLLEDLEKREL